VTILSVNKTMEFGWAQYALILLVGTAVPIFIWRKVMTRKIRLLTTGALIAALYVALTHWQNFLIPGSATWAIQFRVSEALCVFALFTPAAIPGLTLGCMLFNLSYAGALPLDFLVGTLATAVATAGMYGLRRVTVKGYPLPAMLLPAVSNGFLVGWELTVYVGGGFWLNALYVAVGEMAVLLILGTALFYAMKARGLDKRLFN